MAIGENGPGSTGTVHGMVFANFKSGLYCANLPFGNATTICFPLGDQQAQLQFTINTNISRKFIKKNNRFEAYANYRAFSDRSNEKYSKLFVSLITYAPNVPSLRQTANVFAMTGFHRICLTFTPSILDNIIFD